MSNKQCFCIDANSKEMPAIIEALKREEKESKEKHVTKSEKKNRLVARKSLVAAMDIKRGTPFTKKNLTAKRPGSGISPMELKEILGNKASRDYALDDLIELDEND